MARLPFAVFACLPQVGKGWGPLLAFLTLRKHVFIDLAEACGSRIHHPFREGTRRRL